jgi:peptidoglycan/LPS O-acetylase OafA/YrhL
MRCRRRRREDEAMSTNLNQPLGGHDKSNFIQVWRGIAALLVIYYHLSNRVPPEYLGMHDRPSIIFYSGKIGVLIFFIISGYLIVQSLQFSRNLASFYAKRISRIWPLFILASVIIFLFLQFFDPPMVPSGPKKFFVESRSVVDLFGSIFFLEDLGFHWMDGVFWSILVELKFYMWIGILAVIDPKQFVRWFSMAAIVISGAEMLIEVANNPALRSLQLVLNGFLIAQYLPFFAIGGLLVTRKNPELLTAVVVLSLIQAGFKTAMNPDLDAFKTAQFAFVLVGIVALDAVLLKSRIFLVLGDYSYSWYLFHQMIGLSLIKWLSGTLNYDGALLVALATTFLISVVASWAAEWRFRNSCYQLLMAIFSRLGLQHLKPSARVAEAVPS